MMHNYYKRVERYDSHCHGGQDKVEAGLNFQPLIPHIDLNHSFQGFCAECLVLHSNLLPGFCLVACSERSGGAGNFCSYVNWHCRVSSCFLLVLNPP